AEERMRDGCGQGDGGCVALAENDRAGLRSLCVRVNEDAEAGTADLCGCVFRRAGDSRHGGHDKATRALEVEAGFFGGQRWAGCFAHAGEVCSSDAIGDADEGDVVVEGFAVRGGAGGGAAPVLAAVGEADEVSCGGGRLLRVKTAGETAGGGVDDGDGARGFDRRRGVDRGLGVRGLSCGWQRCNGEEKDARNLQEWHVLVISRKVLMRTVFVEEWGLRFAAAWVCSVLRCKF